MSKITKKIIALLVAGGLLIAVPVFVVYEKTIMSSKDAPFAQRPSFNFDTQRWEWLWGGKMPDSLAQFITLTDSANKNYPIILSQNGLKGSLKMAAPNNLDPDLNGKLYNEKL